MRNLSSFKGVTLNTEELRQIEGGGNIPILRLTGVLVRWNPSQHSSIFLQMENILIFQELLLKKEALFLS